MVASVPLDTSRTCSTGSTRATISSASATSPSVGVPYDVPRAGCGTDRLHHVRMGMAEEQRPPRADQVDVAPAVGVGQPGAAALHHEAGGAAHGPERADRGVDAARGDGQRALEQRVRRGSVERIARGGVVRGSHACHPRSMRRGRNISLVLAVYLVIGIIVAYDQNYITSGLLKRLVSALLAIFLWPLLLLDVDLHVG